MEISRFQGLKKKETTSRYLDIKKYFFLTLTKTMTSLTTEADTLADTNNQAAAAAADALVQIATLDRHASMDTIRELVKTVIASEEHASCLPVLICHLRNHSKSLGQGNGGGGERLSTERLAIALYECDPSM